MVKQLPDVKWLDEIIVCPGPDRDQPAVGIIQGCNDQDRCPAILRICPQHPTEFEAVRLRHHQVEDEKIRVFSVRDLDCLAAFIQCNDFVTIHEQYLLEEGC